MKLFLPLLTFLFLLSCDDQEQDQTLVEDYTVMELFEDFVCHVNCGETSPCEGQNILLRGTLKKPYPLVPWTHLEEFKDSTLYTIEVKVDLSNLTMFKHLDSLYDSPVQVQSILEGEDRALNFDCYHLFYVEIEDVEQIN